MVGLLKAGSEAYRSLLGGGGWQGGSGEGGAKRMSSDRACPSSLCFSQAQRTDCVIQNTAEVGGLRAPFRGFVALSCQTLLVFKELPF